MTVSAKFTPALVACITLSGKTGRLTIYNTKLYFCLYVFHKFINTHCAILATKAITIADTSADSFY